MVVYPVLAPYILKNRFAVVADNGSIFSSKYTNPIKQITSSSRATSSTTPASPMGSPTRLVNAAWTLERLRRRWREVLGDLL